MTLVALTPEEKRKEQHYRRLRTRNPLCLTCGYNKHLRGLQYSHLAPRGFHDDGGVQCLLCHAERTEDELDLPYSPQTQNPQMEIIGRYLLALSEWFVRIAETIAAFGNWLLGQADHVRPHQPAVEA